MITIYILFGFVVILMIVGYMEVKGKLDDALHYLDKLDRKVNFEDYDKDYQDIKTDLEIEKHFAKDNKKAKND